MADIYENGSASADTFGTQGDMVTPDNGNDLEPFAKAVTVVDISGGDVLQVLPVDNADGDWVTVTGVSVGYTPPWRVRRVGASTTCIVASVLW